MQTPMDPQHLIGRKAFDSNGTKIGTVGEVYLDDATGEPEWAAVRSGLLRRGAFVPLEPSEVDGDGLRVPFARTLIKDAPALGVGRHLSPEQELLLYRHYGLAVPETGGETPASPPPDQDFGWIAGAENGTGDRR